VSWELGLGALSAFSCHK